jgi:hypothetical protein
MLSLATIRNTMNQCTETDKTKRAQEQRIRWADKKYAEDDK